MSKLRDQIAAHEAAMKERQAKREKEKFERGFCTRCKAPRILNISSHPSDLNNVEYQGAEKEGYLPNVKGICSGDDINIAVCLECGQVQGNFPIPEEPMDKYFEAEEY